jgi:hypothetical protein
MTADEPRFTALFVNPSAVCTGISEDKDDETDLCGEPSRFVVARSDGDTSYGAGGGTEEACETHLADAVTGMISGDVNVQAIVTIRWDEPRTPPLADDPAKPVAIREVIARELPGEYR